DGDLSGKARRGARDRRRGGDRGSARRHLGVGSEPGWRRGMSRVSPLLSSFNGGEWSPHLYGRADLSRYGSAGKRVENFIPLVQGAATRRPGTRFVAPTKDLGGVRLIPFEFSITQAYVIEAGAGYFRFYMNGGRIETTPGVPYEIVSPYGAQHL